MGDGSGGTRVGSGTHTCLIGEEAALDAQHHTGARKTAEDRLEVKCVCHNDRKDRGQFSDICDDHKDTDGDIKGRHRGNEDGRDLSDDVSGKENIERRDSKDNADRSGKDAGFKIRRVNRERRDDIVGLKPVEAKRKGGDQRDSEYDAEWPGAESPLYVVSGTSLKGVALSFLVDLGQRTLDESRGRSQDRHEPHPERGARSAQDDRGRDACHIAGSYTGSSGDHQRLE